MNKLLDKYKVFEWLNPILNGETCDNNLIFPQYNKDDNCNDLILDPPSWLDCGQSNSGDVIQGNGNNTGRDVIGTMYINGEPVSGSGIMTPNKSVDYWRKNVITNYFNYASRIQSLIPNNTYHDMCVSNEDILISNVIIQKMIPVNTGIGINIYLSFNINEINYFGCFYKYAVKDNTGYEFICEPLIKEYNEVSFIKIKGKLRNIIEKWMLIETGIYQLNANEIIVYNDLGQLDRLKKDDIIEVIKSTNDKIQINRNEQKWYIKTPIYWWFNYYFTKIK